MALEDLSQPLLLAHTNQPRTAGEKHDPPFSKHCFRSRLVYPLTCRAILAILGVGMSFRLCAPVSRTSMSHHLQSLGLDVFGSPTKLVGSSHKEDVGHEWCSKCVFLRPAPTTQGVPKYSFPARHSHRFMKLVPDRTLSLDAGICHRFSHVSEL